MLAAIADDGTDPLGNNEISSEWCFFLEPNCKLYLLRLEFYTQKLWHWQHLQGPSIQPIWLLEELMAMCKYTNRHGGRWDVHSGSVLAYIWVIIKFFYTRAWSRASLLLLTLLALRREPLLLWTSWVTRLPSTCHPQPPALADLMSSPGTEEGTSINR